MIGCFSNQTRESHKLWLGIIVDSTSSLMNYVVQDLYD